MGMDDQHRLELICEAVRYCQRAKSMGMPSRCWSKALREPIFFLWETRFTRLRVRAARYRSRAAKGLQHGKRSIVYDHAIPFRLQQEELLHLRPVEPATVRPVLERFAIAAIITTDEDRYLSKRFHNRMPPDWDGRDPLARYHAVGIEMVDNEAFVGECSSDAQRLA